MLSLVTSAVWGLCPHPMTGGSQFRELEGCVINRMYAPQCGTDGCNYVNGDALRCANSQALRSNLPGVEMNHFGMCEDVNEVVPEVVEVVTVEEIIQVDDEVEVETIPVNDGEPEIIYVPEDMDMLNMTT